MPTYQKEAFDVPEKFRPVWDQFMAIKPADLSRAAHIRTAIREYVEKHSNRKERKSK